MSEGQANGLADTAASGNGTGPDAAASSPAETGGAGERRPEIAVGAAFAGGFLLALLLRRARS